jgi:hypothetical protein
MDKNLELMVDLQKVDKELKKFDDLLEKLPAEVEQHSHDLKAAQEEMEKFKTELEAKKKLRAEKERGVEEKNEAVAKGKTKLHDIKTNQEYTAALAEIENMSKAVSRLEDEELELMEEIELSGDPEKVLKEKVAKEEKVFAEIKNQNNAKIEEVKGERGTVASKRDEVRSQLDASFAKQYDKIAAMRNGLATSEMKEDFCTECHTSVRPQMAVEVRSGKGLHTCPACLRFLYVEQTVEETAS